jgi:hypothetical protein
VCENERVPAVVVVTEVFANLAAQAARARGYGSLATLVLPHPMETKSVAEIVDITRARLGDIVAALTTAR